MELTVVPAKFLGVPAGGIYKISSVGGEISHAEKCSWNSVFSRGMFLLNSGARGGVVFLFLSVPGLSWCGVAFLVVPGGFRVVLGCSGVFSGAGSGAGI